MSEYQAKITEYPIDKSEARSIAYNLIREKYGNIPSIGSPQFEKETGVWIIPIHVKYPRIMFDKIQEIPKKVRFLSFENLGLIKINAITGVVIDKPSYFNIRNEVRERLVFVQSSVQKALVKIGANKFSQLPLSEHMHTPIEDIVSYLLLNDHLNLKEDLISLNQQEFEKYIKNIEILSKVGLVRRNNDFILPDNALIEIESSYEEISQKLSAALAYFFEKGFNDIRSIQQVLGPHLTISGFIYETSFEYDNIMEVSYHEIERILSRAYSDPSKILKLPRYLIQLEKVGLISQKELKGETYWLPQNEIYSEVLMQDEILSPIKSYLLKATVL